MDFQVEACLMVYFVTNAQEIAFFTDPGRPETQPKKLIPKFFKNTKIPVTEENFYTFLKGCALINISEDKSLYFFCHEDLSEWSQKCKKEKNISLSARISDDIEYWENVLKENGWVKY